MPSRPLKTGTPSVRAFASAGFGRWCAVCQTAPAPLCKALSGGRVDVSSVINSDRWSGYNNLVDLGYGHLCVDHGNDEFVKGAVHINGHLHLKETEWRYNNRHQDKYRTLLTCLRNNP